MGANELIEINIYQALKGLKLAVEERGRDYVYRDQFNESYRDSGVCQYVVGGKCACLVGLALLKLGVTLRELSLMENGSIDVIALPDRVKITNGGMVVLKTAQRVQDGNMPWGVAFDAAEIVGLTVTEVDGVY